MNPSPSLTPVAVSGFDGFLLWVATDPGAVATFVGVLFSLLAAIVAASISWKAYRATKVYGERELGMGRYRIAIEYMHAEPFNAALAIEGARILKFLLRSSWPAREDREMVEEALAAYMDELTGSA